MTENDFSEIYDSAEDLLAELENSGFFLDKNTHITDKAERLRISLRKVREEAMALFNQSRILWLETEKEYLQHQTETPIGKEKQDACAIYVSHDTIKEIYKKVNNHDCSMQKAIDITNYIVQNYDGVIGLNRFCENVCQQMADDGLLLFNSLFSIK